MMEKIIFTDPVTNETDSFYVLEETTLNGTTYLLVTVEETEDSDAYIMKLLSGGTEDEVIYEIVEDEAELDALSKLFSELLEDTDIES